MSQLKWKRKSNHTIVTTYVRPELVKAFVGYSSGDIGIVSSQDGRISYRKIFHGSAINCIQLSHSQNILLLGVGPYLYQYVIDTGERFLLLHFDKTISCLTWDEDHKRL